MLIISSLATKFSTLNALSDAEKVQAKYFNRWNIQKEKKKIFSFFLIKI